MPTIVDSLVISIGLDPSGFQKGQKEIATYLQKTEEHVTKTGKVAEGSGNQMAAGFETAARKLLGLYALFTAGTEIKAFVANITNADAALGRFATTIGIAPGAFASWSNAIERQGGSAAEAAAAFSNLNQSIQNLRANGQADSRIDAMLRIGSLGGTPIDLWHGTPDTIFKQLNADLASIRKRYGQAAASFRASEAGFGDNVGLFMSQDPAKVAAALAESERLGHANAASAKAAQELLSVWRGLKQASEDLGRSILTTLAPAIEDALKGLEHWIEANKEWLKNEINSKVKEFVDFVRSIDWKSIAEGINNFVHDVNGAAGAVGGWKAAIELLFGLWTGAQFARVIANVRLLRAAQIVPPGTGWAAIAAAAGYAAYREATDPYGNASAQRGTGLIGMRKHQRDRNEDQGGPWGTVRDAGKRAWNWLTGKKPPVGNMSSAGNLTNLINQISREEGIDPRIIQGIRAGESGHGRRYDVGDVNDGGAYGPLQFNMGRGRLGDRFYRETGYDPRDPSTIPAQIRYAARLIKRNLDKDPSFASGGSASRLHAIWHGYHGMRDADLRWGDSGYVPAPSAPTTRSIVTTMPPNPRASSYSAFGRPITGMHSWHSTLRDLHEATKPLPAHVVPGLAGLRAAAANRVAGGAGLTSVDRSSSAETHIGEVHVHTQATDATGIARDMRKALENHAYASSANTGLR